MLTDRDKLLLVMKDWLGIKDRRLGIQANLSLQGRTIVFPQLPTLGCPQEGDVTARGKRIKKNEERLSEGEVKSQQEQTLAPQDHLTSAMPHYKAAH